MKFFKGAPCFAAEVRSEGDYGPTAERDMAEKRRDYFDTGTLVVWDVDLLSRETVRVYRASDPQTPTIYRRGEMADAEPAVPGWTMPVDDLFEPIHRRLGILEAANELGTKELRPEAALHSV